MESTITVEQPVPEPLTNLNDAQMQAVEATEGAVLVLAGAGTGKTKVLTSRIAHILGRQLAWPSQILSVTFTNKAAREMKDRIADMVGGEQSSGLWLGTFHSICLRILRRHPEAVGLKPGFSIVDMDDQIRLLKQLFAENNIDEKKLSSKATSIVIQRWKDRALTPEKVSEEDNGTMASIYKMYQKRLVTLNAVDFGDLLLHCINIFTANNEILSEYHRRFKYILVDEYQDTNVAQYLWLKLLTQGSGNICCVGDDDQSIYGWRGAEVENILRFEKDFSNRDGSPVKVIRLEYNYRSTPEILAAASAVIDNNKDRLGKTLHSSMESGNKVKVVSLWDEKAEASYVGDEIETLQQLRKHKLNDMAILVRAGFQTRSFEECFISMGIPYRVVGGLRFYERMEIRDAIAYIRAVLQPENDLALERIINTPRRGIGGSTIEQLRGYSRENGVPLSEALRRGVSQGFLKSRPRSVLGSLISDFDKWAKLFKEKPHHEAVDIILKESGYINMWRNDKNPDALGRIDNLKELVAALQEFEDIEQFLEHVSLVTEGDDAVDADMVSIMTMHGAKGLEFNTVFLTGWEEGLFPSQRSMDENGAVGLEEERRLAYVGITRAKQNLHITFAVNRRVYGQWISSIPSRFIDELPPDVIEVTNTGAPQYQRQEPKKTWLPSKSTVSSPTPSNNQLPVTNHRLKTGTSVSHKKFGDGKVLSVSGDHVKILFKTAGIKTIMEEYIKVVE